jgi:serine/threonine protein kinase
MNMSEARQVGKYKITGLLGTGGQGQVHSAIDSDLGREVAIKSLHQAQGVDKATVERFRSEAKSLARIVHSNITTLIDFFPIGDNLYMIMELVRGHTLDQILSDRGRGLGVKESVAIIAQAADGLSYAHQMDVIHRDIKPSNLMITDSGRVKLMDFGIARVRGSDRLTRVGSAIGTPLYMSPEQCLGADGDERSDIYSLAVVFYELLSGAPPFQGATDRQLADAHIKTPPPPLVPRIADVTPQLEAAVMTALSKRPEQRYPTMRAFSNAIGGTAVLADAPSIVKGYSHLVETPTSSQDTARNTGFTSVAFKVVQSRSATLMRRFNGLHPALKGVTIGFSAFALLAGFMFWPTPIAVQPERNRDAKIVYNSPPQTNTDRPQSGCNNRTIVNCPPSGTPSNGVQVATHSATIRQDTAPRPAAEMTLAELGKSYRNQDGGKALEAAKKLAHASENGEGGAKEAQYYLGAIYLNGYGNAQKSEKTAFEWFLKSANQGYAAAQYQVGFMYNSGTGTSSNDCLAKYWFEKAADQNEPHAQYSLGYFHQEGVCGPPSEENAFKFFKLAADQNYEKAIIALKTLKK